MAAKLGAPEMIAYEGPLGHMATLKDGRIVSAYTSRLPDADQRLDTDNPETPVYLRISHDNGLTWTEPYRAFTYPPGKGVTGSCFPLVAPDGTLHVLALRFYKIGGNFAAESKSHSTVLHNASADGGKTWTEIHNVDYGKRYTGALNSAIALNSGRLLLVLSSPSDRHGGRNVCVSTYSDDGGVTWHPSFQEIIVPDGELPGHPGALEPVVVELLDGRIWMIIRTQTGCFYQSCSTDDGVTWSDPTQTRFQAPNAPAGLCRLADKRIVLCWNDLSQYPVGIEGSQRQFLHIAISDDDGNTFGRSKEIARRRKEDRADTNVAYPFLCQAPDGHILVLYYRVGCAEGVGTRSSKYCESILIGSLPKVDPSPLSIWTELFSYAHHEIHEIHERDAKSAEHFKALPVGFLCVLCTEQVHKRRRASMEAFRRRPSERVRKLGEEGVLCHVRFPGNF